MEKNTILAIVLSLVIIIAWNFLYIMPQQKRLEQQKAAQQQTQTQENSGSTSPVAQTVPVTPNTPAIPIATAPRALREEAQDVVIETPLLHLTLSTQGARLTSWKTLAYNGSDGEPVEFVSDDARQRGQFALEVFTGNAQLDEELNSALYQPSETSVKVNPTDEAKTVTLTYATTTAGTFAKEFMFRADSYKVDVTLKFLAPPADVKSITTVLGPGMGKNLETVASFMPEIVSTTGIQTKPIRDAAKKIDGLLTHNNVSWAAMNEKYFTMAFFPASANNTLSINKIALQPKDEKEKIAPIREILMGVSQPLEAGKCSLSVYAGPKALKELEHAYQGFERLIDYGTFGFIAAPLAGFMTYLYAYLKNYGLVIIVLTVLIKIVFYPLTHKSYTSMKKMQDLQPQMRSLQEKYKNDKQQLNQAMMELYKEKGVNPMGGCLPMLLQMPVFFALYQALSQSIELRGASFLWIADLSASETLFFKPLVLLMGVTMFAQQAMTPTTVADNRQAQMFKFMPIMFTAMFWNFPAGLVLYWLMNNVLTIGQQYLINKTGNTPKTKAKETSDDKPSRRRRK
ncbi:membrane protein oxaA [Candidatus Moduliflexus flocculans]|uniref:Membrane protein insertase YidC n=1 Tax=Candidatus Moduliflexus flocculans TaxID=1499966 RepID=A0A0S6VSH1_9BACT|nr:membrane protein oxaA [Candidatus Moduliflexus flocculans]